MSKKILISVVLFLGFGLGSFAAADYCAPSTQGGPGSDVYIARVLLTGSNGALDNTTVRSTSTPAHYDYFSGAFVPVLEPGQQYTLTIQAGTHIFGDVNIAAWLDFNGDQTFSSDDKIMEAIGLGPDVFTGITFTVPSTGTTSATRLRVMALHAVGSFDPCYVGTNEGETEDYDINARPSSPLIGGGKRYIPPVDYCPEGDFSATQYDSLCSGISPMNGVLAGAQGSVNTGTVSTGAVLATGSVVSTGSVDNLTGEVDDEIELTEEELDEKACADIETQHAFRFAFANGITTMPDCKSAKMRGFLLRKHAAKMIVNFAKNVLGKTPDLNRTCVFSDMNGQERELQKYAVEACQLGIMGLKGDGTPATTFSPDKSLDKAQYSTMISRLIYGEENNTDEVCRYCKHVEALHMDGIIARIDRLAEPFQRGPAMIMMMRVKNRK